METTIVEIKNIEDCKNIFDKAKIIIEGGGLVAFPTETVYGLGGNALSKESAKKIYAAKGRPGDNPLILHVASLYQFKQLSRHLTKNAILLAGEFWPGPMTLVVPKSDLVPEVVEEILVDLELFLLGEMVEEAVVVFLEDFLSLFNKLSPILDSMS